MMRIGAHPAARRWMILTVGRPVGCFMSMAINPTSQMSLVTSKKLGLIHRSSMRPLPTSQLTMRFETTTIGLLPQAAMACQRSTSMAIAYSGLYFSILQAGRLLFDFVKRCRCGRISPHELQHPKTDSR